MATLSASQQPPNHELSSLAGCSGVCVHASLLTFDLRGEAGAENGAGAERGQAPWLRHHEGAVIATAAVSGGAL